jgi:hypothetical protein
MTLIPECSIIFVEITEYQENKKIRKNMGFFMVPRATEYQGYRRPLAVYICCSV